MIQWCLLTIALVNWEPMLIQLASSIETLNSAATVGISTA
jgi:hypothetical protein